MNKIGGLVIDIFVLIIFLVGLVTVFFLAVSYFGDIVWDIFDKIGEVALDIFGGWLE